MASLIPQLVKNLPAMQETPIWFLGQEDPLEKGYRLPTPVFLGFPCGLAGKESACNEGDLGLIPGFGRSPGEGKSYPLQYTSRENSLDWIVHGVAKSWTWLSDFHFTPLLLRVLEGPLGPWESRQTSLKESEVILRFDSSGHDLQSDIKCYLYFQAEESNGNVTTDWWRK